MKVVSREPYSLGDRWGSRPHGNVYDVRPMKFLSDLSPATSCALLLKIFSFCFPFFWYCIRRLVRSLGGGPMHSLRYRGARRATCAHLYRIIAVESAIKLADLKRWGSLCRKGVGEGPHIDGRSTGYTAKEVGLNEGAYFDVGEWDRIITVDR